ncbi:5-oxoprolinase subunit PxpA [Kushneria aurantia]|uniref:5-oxoprolinase subunit A n=1 Tax=Kushneria aurantia TaxID=504092 RepID=A0ABV6FYF3_9GAMM|nr:5-oxoprolinase subunit PxpA [Kushneria aurantia]
MPVPLLNCDMGESFGNWKMGLDEEVMAWIDCANIACGFHASDPGIMRHTAALALRHGVEIGAHPAYPDLQGFGRRSMTCTPAEVEAMLLYQVGALEAICRAEGGRVSYVKPHGALYQDMTRDPELLRAIMRAIHALDARLPLLVMATADTGAVRAMAEEEGISLRFESFADRAYDAEGLLVSRRLPGAVHHDREVIVDQALRLARGEALETIDGHSLVLASDTLCVHGDNAESVAAVRAIREAFNAMATS